MPLALIILAIVVIVTAAVIGHRRAEQRRQALKAWAASRGFSFASAKNTMLAKRFPDQKALHRGRSRQAHNVMTGEHGGRRLWAFDYRYVTGNGKNRRTHNLSAVVIESSHPLLPLFIRREHVFDKVGEFVGLDDIDFESAEFSGKFYVKSPDKRWAYDVIHTEMMEFLLTHCQQKVQFDGKYIMVYGRGGFSEQRYAKAVELIHGIYERIPAYVIEEMTGQKTARRSRSNTRSSS